MHGVARTSARCGKLSRPCPPQPLPCSPRTIGGAVHRRRREIGMRIALGALPSHVSFMVLRQGLVLAASGLVIGLALGLMFSRLLSSLLFGLPPTDPAAFGGAAAVLLGVAALASYLPARRATRVDPTIALRSE